MFDLWNNQLRQSFHILSTVQLFFVKRSESPGPFQRFSQMGFFLKDSEKALQGIIWGRTCRNGRVGVLQEVACGKSWKKLVKWEDQIGVRQCSDPSPPGSVCLLTSGHSGHEQGVGASSYNSHKYGIVRRLPASPYSRTLLMLSCTSLTPATI